MNRPAKNKVLVLFDFDGTLTYKDSFIDFLLFSEGLPRCLLGLVCLSPQIVLYFLKIISNEKAKQAVFKWFFRGREYTLFKEKTNLYSVKRIPLILRDHEKKRMMWHKSENHEIVLVSASLEAYLGEWCRSNGIDCIGTKIEVKDGRVSGEFSTRNCYGAEKVKRIKEKYNPEEYHFIYAYGDTRGDREMLALAHEKFYKGNKL